ncbi:MAG: DUF479 domain-containing protein [Desulfobulbaceae bacterium]|nr:MAG: DUF479 domain-containing protein [Desulfobulbaceae bacterium]
MNILGHLYLSGPSSQLLVGNFLGDFVDGEQAQRYHGDIHRGIELHRAIDRYTNAHPQFKKSKAHLWSRHRHYSAVIIDIFYDHFLARNWHNYSEQSLTDFVQDCYATLQDYESLLPDKARTALMKIIDHDWLMRYETIEGLEIVFAGMAQRARFPSQMGSACEDLQKYYRQFEQECCQFLPQIRNWIDEM